jgi:hypothetical protein
MQSSSVAEQRAERMAAYVAEAQLNAPPTATSAAEALAALKSTQRQVWKVRWDNSHKETFWRLAVDGVALYGAARFTHGHPLPCLCCAGRVSRLHHFWDCPIARHVAREVQRCLPANELTRPHLWLLRAPPGVRPCVWQVVALAALSAMESGRRHHVALVQQHEAQRDLATAAARAHEAWRKRPPTAAEAPPPPLPSLTPAGAVLVAQASASAVEVFWAALESFVSLYEQYRPPPAWTDLPADHPFVRTTHAPAAPGAAAGGARLQLAPRPPPALPL